MRRLLTILLALTICSPAFAITKTPNLVAYFPLMGDALDHSGAGITTTVSGAVPAAGLMGGAYDFDGVDDGITLNDLDNAAIVSANRMSVSAWIYNSAATYPIDQRMWIRLGNGPIYMSVGPTFVRFRCDMAGHTAAQATRWWFVLPTSTWVHIAGTRDGTTLRFYINGVLNTTSVVGADTLSFAGSQAIGFYSASGESWQGLIQRVAIYKTALSQPDIKRLMLGLNPLNG